MLATVITLYSVTCEEEKEKTPARLKPAYGAFLYLCEWVPFVVCIQSGLLL